MLAAQSEEEEEEKFYRLERPVCGYGVVLRRVIQQI